jgi:hypothetical protein
MKAIETKFELNIAKPLLFNAALSYENNQKIFKTRILFGFINQALFAEPKFVLNLKNLGQLKSVPALNGSKEV